MSSRKGKVAGDRESNREEKRGKNGEERVLYALKRGKNREKTEKRKGGKNIEKTERRELYML